jgi:preprotein translocase subunit YajC
MGNYTNLSALSDVTPINLNFDNLSTSADILNQIRETTQNEVGNYWFIGAITLIFFMLMWWFYREDKSFAYDMIRSIFISSSWCFFITVAFVLSGWITTIVPLFWFITIFLFCLVSIQRLKEQGL